MYKENEYIYDHSEGKLDMITSSNKHEVQELLDSGGAIKLSLPELIQFEREAAEAYSKFKAKEKEIKESNDPRIKDEEVQKYLLKELEDEFKQKSEEIEEQYAAYRRQKIQDTKADAAKNVQVVTAKDEQAASEFATDAVLDLMGSFGSDSVVDNVVDKIGYLTSDERYALRRELPRIIEHVDDKTQRRKLIDAVKTTNDAELAHEIAKQLPSTVAHGYRNWRIAKNVASS